MSNYPGLIEGLSQSGDSKIVFFIMDGVGGLQLAERFDTELAAAVTPNLDRLAKRSSCGLLIPVAHGVTPGSGPGHFALFGYDPVANNIGRGVLEAAGIGFELTDRDVAVRGNFATIDENGCLVDRRAGRLPTEENRRVCHLLQERVKIEGVEVIVRTVKEHRLLVVFRGDDLSDEINDTDPQATGVPPLSPEATADAARRTAMVAKEFVRQAQEILSAEKAANMLTLRGFAKHRPYASMMERYSLRALCLANYPMYRGVAFLAGMDMNPVAPDMGSTLDALEKKFDDYDFFFVHAKTTDKTGEDGDFAAKVAAIEELDQLLPRILNLNPDVLVITGDHSTPSALRGHSWHPVPVLLASEASRLDRAERFTELECLKGALGQFPAQDLMALALAHAGRLKKFGA